MWPSSLGFSFHWAFHKWPSTTLYFIRPISWLPSFPAILFCHSCRNDSILLGLFRPAVYSFPQCLNMAIGFPTYGLLCSFCFFSWASLARLLPLGFFIPFTNSVFPWAIINFIGLPWLNYFILILGFIGLPLTPYFLCLHYFWTCSGPFSLFLHHILPMGMLFLSFRASLSPFTFSRPICLFHKPVIHHSYRLGLMVLPLVCQTFATLVTRLFAFHLDSKKWPSTTIKLVNYTKFKIDMKELLICNKSIILWKPNGFCRYIVNHTV